METARSNITEIYPGAASGYSLTGPGHGRQSDRDLGMATAEYAICTLAAVGFAGLLVVILKSDEVRGFLLAIIHSALSLQ
ncbi:DUF4244 domain-containing protein [Arthrobacter terrae]|uniref:DUF4244 domain-containing protein n=1 Tax=Arthrobacter terrae TaxID=2935737 RepID=UPI0035E3FA7F